MPSYQEIDPFTFPDVATLPRFFAGEADDRTPVAPLPLGTMNAALEAQAPNIRYPISRDVEYSPSDRYLIQRNQDEQNARLGIDPLAARRAEAQATEQAMQTQGVLEFNQLISGGVTPQEAILRVAPKLTYRHAGNLGSIISHAALPNAIPNSINAVPILDPETKKRIGQSVYDQSGKLHASQFTNPDKPTVDQVAQEKIDREIRADLQSRLNAMRKVQQNAVEAPLHPTLDADISDLEGKLTSMREKAVGKTVNEDETVKVISPEGVPGTLPKSRLAEALKAGYKKR